MIPASEFLIPCGDWNGHVGSTGSGYKEVHGGYGYGKPDPDSEGERILEYALAYDLFLGNTCFKKRDSHLITYRSGNTATQIDFMLFRKSLRKLVMDACFVCLFCCFTSQVNSYGHCGMVSSPNHTFSWASLNKQLTSTSCTYFRL